MFGPRTTIGSTATVLSGLLALLLPGAADAHVKWFAPFDVAAAPRPLGEVLSPAFTTLFLLSALLICVFRLIESTRMGEALSRSLDELGLPFEGRADALMRGGVAVFFTALWVHGNIILTPELKTDLEFVPWLQAAIVVSMFWRQTLPLGALGMAALFAVGLGAYGSFHMMDYPIFLGAAGYLALSGAPPAIARLVPLRPIDIARIGAAVTLLWASVEKWAYPQWSYPVLDAHAGLRLGLPADFYMVAAGAIEFALAFGLLLTPLLRRLSALTLQAMFLSAVVEFGKIDAIGHLVIVIILFVLIAERAPAPAPLRLQVRLPGSYAATLALFIALYYGAHAVLYAPPHEAAVRGTPMVSLTLPTGHEANVQTP